MKLAIITLAGDDAGSVDLSDEIFGLEPRADILQRVVRWQLAKRQAGTHKTLAATRSTGQKKMYKQKGTGGARHGAASAPQFRGGGRAFGPVVRSHAHDLPKKVRALGLQARALRQGEGQQLIVVDSVAIAEAKTKALRDTFAKRGLANVLIIDGAEVDKNLALAAATFPMSTCCRSRASTSTTFCAATAWC